MPTASLEALPDDCDAIRRPYVPELALLTALKQLREIAVLGAHDDWVNTATYSPDGSRVVTASADATARVWDTATGKVVVVLRGHEGGLHSAVFSLDGRRVLTASGDAIARVWDAATGKEIAVLRGHRDFEGAVLSMGSISSPRRMGLH